MKKTSFWATVLALLIVCGLSVTSCSKDEEKNNGGQKEQMYDFSDYINAYCVRCERVGANLVIEMVFENLTNNAINNTKLSMVNGSIKDNFGNTYSTNYANVVLASSTNINSISNYSREWKTLNIPVNGYAIYYIKIYNFDATNTATKVSFDLTFNSSSLPIESFEISAYDFIISDNRVMEKGIQTNDTALVYKVTNCERVGGVVQIDFTLTNDSEIELGDLTFQCAGNATDDLSNNYYTGLYGYGDIAFGAGSYKSSYVLKLKPHETINGRLRINNFDTTNKAKFVSVPISCKSSTYVFSDEVARFLTIPIKDNRPLSEGIQTPDLKLDFNLKSAQVDENGYLVVNYTIQNNTGEGLTNVTFKGDGNWLDDLSNSYYDNSLKFSFNGSDFKSAWWVGDIVNIAANATIPAALRLETPFDTRAKNVSFSLGISCDNYDFVDNKVRFLTIPIKK